MPLEIRELVIKVDIQEAAPAQLPDLEQHLEAWKNKVVEQCIQQVFTRLENLSHR